MQAWVQGFKQASQRFWQQLAAELEGGAALAAGPQRRDWSDVAAVAASVQAPPWRGYRMHRVTPLQCDPHSRWCMAAISLCQLLWPSLCCRFRT